MQFLTKLLVHSLSSYFLHIILKWIDSEDLEIAQEESNPVAYHEAWRKLCGCRYSMSNQIVLFLACFYPFVILFINIISNK